MRGGVNRQGTVNGGPNLLNLSVGALVRNVTDWKVRINAFAGTQI